MNDPELPSPVRESTTNSPELQKLHEQEVISVIAPDEQFTEDELAEPPLEEAQFKEWKDALRVQFEIWLGSIDQIPPLESDDESNLGSPDLYSFHAELAALSAETRKGNRRTAEAFSQWGETLGAFDTGLKQLREHMATLPVAATEDAVPRAYCLALAEIADRLHRILEGFNRTPLKSWWGGGRLWTEAWTKQRQAFGILESHFDALLEKAGLRRLEVKGEPFDPTRMVAIATENDPAKPHQVVLEQMAPGYLLGGEVLRPAQVKVNLNKASA